MRPFSELTDRGKARRLRPLVASVLPAWGLGGARFRLLEVASNVVFRIEGPDGPLALKVDILDEHAPADTEVALAWLDALSETDLDVVGLVRTLDGCTSVFAGAPGVADGRRCVLYRWVRGRTMFDQLSAPLYRQLGSITARLHAHALTYTPATEPTRWDRVYYSEEPVVIYDEPPGLTPRQRDLVLRATEAVEPVLRSVYATPGRLIHGDLHGWNIHVDRGRLVVLDFDDVMWGHPVHDLSITFGYYRNRDEYPEWIAAFEEGYRAVAPWPVDDPRVVDALMVARRLLFVNTVLQQPHGDWDAMLTAWCAMFETWLG